MTERVPLIKLAVIGLGKIARDQHLPALAKSPAFELVGAASPKDTLDGLPSFFDIETLRKDGPNFAAVAICTTPQVRYAIARYALGQGLHVLLEKPPGVTVSEVLELADLASRAGVTLFAAWHSRHAPAVEPARAWLLERKILNVHVTWKEDVRVWHPGQQWIWQAGGLGVFDPGINALSILTHIFPHRIAVMEAELAFPRNCETPIAAKLALDSKGAPINMDLDFRQTSRPTWDIRVETDAGRLALSMGGESMTVDGHPVTLDTSAEYASVYAHFADLIRGRRSDADVAPLQLVADAFLCGRRVEVEAFKE